MKSVRISLLVAALAVSPSSPARAAFVTIIGQVSSQGYRFTNFDGPTPNTAGTVINGISNSGTVVGFSTPDGATFNNFTANPLTGTTANTLNINGATAAMANGVNSSGTVVGLDGNNNAFTLSGGTISTYIPFNGTSAIAFGINDNGLIVGQYTNVAGVTPGYVRNGANFATINAPSGPDSVNAQGINNNGLIVGFYLGTDGNDHGFKAQYNFASPLTTLTGTAIADPTIPVVPGEPGATFVFSQILGINDQGIAVGYYGDSTTSQHGFLYNINTGQYTFLDDPAEGFSNGVEVTQITGINNAGEITGFYLDANGVSHGFVALAVAVPEPASMLLTGLGMASALGWAARIDAGARSPPDGPR